MLIDFKYIYIYIYLLCLSTMCHENKLSRHIKSFSIFIMYFQSHHGSSFGSCCRILHFCGNNGPLPNVIFCALHFRHSLLNWRLKFMEMTECLQNYRFYRTINLIYSSEEKLKFTEKLLISEDFSARELRWDDVKIWGYAAWSYHCLQKRK